MHSCMSPPLPLHYSFSFGTFSSSLLSNLPNRMIESMYQVFSWKGFCPRVEEAELVESWLLVDLFFRDGLIFIEELKGFIAGLLCPYY